MKRPVVVLAARSLRGWRIDVTKPYEFIGFGAMDVTKPYEFIGFGAMDVTKPYKSIGFLDRGPTFRSPRAARV